MRCGLIICLSVVSGLWCRKHLSSYEQLVTTILALSDGIFESCLEIDSTCVLHVCYLIDAVHILEQLFLCKNLDRHSQYKLIVQFSHSTQYGAFMEGNTDKSLISSRLLLSKIFSDGHS